MKPIKIMSWAAWIIFLVSLFLPMERNTMSGPCEWPCTQPFIYTGFENSFAFLLSPLALVFQMLAWDGFKTYMVFLTYSLIGMGELLILITPILENKLNSPFRQNLHMLLAFVAVTAILCYGLLPDIRMGIDPLLRGYYWMVASFLLASLTSILRISTMRVANPLSLQP